MVSRLPAPPVQSRFLGVRLDVFPAVPGIRVVLAALAILTVLAAGPASAQQPGPLPSVFFPAGSGSPSQGFPSQALPSPSPSVFFPSNPGTPSHTEGAPQAFHAMIASGGFLFPGFRPEDLLQGLGGDGCWGPCKQMIYDQLLTGKIASFPPPEKSDAVIMTGTLASLLKSRAPLTLIDARTTEEPGRKSIPGSKPLSVNSSEEEIRQTIPDPKMMVVVWSDRKNPGASGSLAARLESLGYLNVIDYRDGLEAWINAGGATD